MHIVRFTGGLGNQLFQLQLYERLIEIYGHETVYADVSYYKSNPCHSGFELKGKVELNTIDRVPRKKILIDETTFDNNLMNINEEVYTGINTSPWYMTWFVSTKVSNHQKGLAIDVSLGKIKDVTDKNVGNYLVKEVTLYEEYKMPSAMHELSIKAVRFTTPVASHSKTAWKNAKFSEAMANNEYAIRLQDYCTNAGLTPLASEWWHYNDLDSLEQENGNGRFNINNVYSNIPK